MTSPPLALPMAVISWFAFDTLKVATFPGLSACCVASELGGFVDCMMKLSA